MRALLIAWFGLQAAAVAGAQACRPEKGEPHPWK